MKKGKLKGPMGHSGSGQIGGGRDANALKNVLPPVTGDGKTGSSRRRKPNRGTMKIGY